MYLKWKKYGGKVGGRAKIPDVQKMLDMRWSEVLSETTGCENYAAFRKSLSKINKKPV